MKSLRLFLLAATLGAGILMAADDRPPTAFETLKTARKQLGDRIGANLLSMESDHAKLRPRFWWLRFYDDQLFLKLRAIMIIGPEIIRNVEPGNIFDGGDKRYIIEPDLLKVDSDKCIAFMEKAARENNIPLYSRDVRLEKPHTEETNPIWYFTWHDEKGGTLGKISISATTAKVIEIVGLRIKTPRFQSVARKTAGQEVEDTFLGIGGDMEEFFTGKRTVDKDTSAPASKSEPSPKKEEKTD